MNFVQIDFKYTCFYKRKLYEEHKVSEAQNLRIYDTQQNLVLQMFCIIQANLEYREVHSFYLKKRVSFIKICIC